MGNEASDIISTVADDDYKVAPENRVKHVSGIHEEVAVYFVHDLGLRLRAFVKANPDLELDAVNSLHTVIDSVEAECARIREALQELDRPAHLDPHPDEGDPSAATAPTVEVPLCGNDGVPICNASAAWEHRAEYHLAWRRTLEALLAEPGFDFIIQKSRIVLQAKTEGDGWTALTMVERKKTRTEICDFEAREKALGEFVNKHVTVEVIEDAPTAEAA